jgi:imidazolonepropionase-like amidohydrolase
MGKRPGLWRLALIGVLATAPSAASEQEGGADRASLEARSRALVEAVPVVAHPTTVVRGVTVLTAAGQRYDDGHVAFADGRITSVGEGPGPDATRVVAGKGWFVTPGLIDTHSHLGVYPSPEVNAHQDGNEAVAPTTAGVWAENAVWPQDPGFQRAVAGGITALQILPGSANLIGGRGVILRPTPARGARAMRFPGAPETVKMACGENPKRVYGERGGPSTRMGNVAGLRDALLRAQRYREGWKAHDEAVAAPEVQGKRKPKEEPKDPPKAPDRDPALDTLAGVLDGSILAQIHCYRADDMMAILQVAEEFGFSVRSFHHAVEAYKIRDVLAERGVAVSTWSDWWGFKLEAYDAVLTNAAMVAVAGGRAIIHSDSEIGIQRLNQEAGKAWYDGIAAGFVVTEDEALGWITANPAWALGIEAETGTLEVGKRADLVVWDGHPFSVYSRAQQVFIDGVRWHDAEQPVIWSDFEIGQEVNR